MKGWSNAAKHEHVEEESEALAWLGIKQLSGVLDNTDWPNWPSMISKLERSGLIACLCGLYLGHKKLIIQVRFNFINQRNFWSKMGIMQANIVFSFSSVLSVTFKMQISSIYLQKDLTKFRWSQEKTTST